MLKTLFKLFPLIDHLYIYQNYEYSSGDFLKWFLKNPLKRNLQKKHKIVWTYKAKLIFLISISLVIFDSISTSIFFTQSLIFTIPLIIIKSIYAPIFLIIAKVLLSPLEYYQKQKIISLTKDKLKKFTDLKVVAITGSFGKTSTKDILYTLLFKKFYVVKTPKSFNTPLGISQTILEDAKKNTEVFICEVGAYKRGEIKNIMELIKPNIGIITAIAPQHLERFGSLENIALAKFELPQSLDKEGIAILNGRYEKITELAQSLISKVIFYGEENSHFFATNIKSSKNGTSFKMHTPKGIVDITIPLIGQHHAQNFLAASAAALQLGLTLSEIKERAKLLLPTPHRMEIKKLGEITLIDNSYNTNPKSAESSVKLIEEFDADRKILITPGFIELGKKSHEENKKFGKDIAVVADEVIIVGENSKKELLEGVKEVWPGKNNIYFVNSTQEGLILSQKLANGYKKAVVLLENDLPDQYS